MHLDDAARAAGHRHVVGDDDHRAAFGVDFVEDSKHLFAAAAVERAGRLVRQDHIGAVDQRAGDGDTLLLAAGKLPRRMRESTGHAETIEQARRPVATLSGRQAGVNRRHLHVSDRGELAEQMIALENEAEMLAPQFRQLIDGQHAGIAAGDTVMPRRRPVEAAEDVHQRRLARAGRADDRDHLAGIDADIDVVERDHGGVAGGIDTAEPVEDDQGLAHPTFPTAAGRASASTRSRRLRCRSPPARRRQGRCGSPP